MMMIIIIRVYYYYFGEPGQRSRHSDYMYRAGGSVGRMPAGERDFLLLCNVQTGSGAHPASYSMGTATLFREYSGRGVKFNIHHHQELTLRMSAALTLLPLSDLTESTGQIYLCLLLVFYL